MGVGDYVVVLIFVFGFRIMDFNEMFVVYCCFFDFIKGFGIGFLWGIKIVFRRVIIFCVRCYNYGIID